MREPYEIKLTWTKFLRFKEADEQRNKKKKKMKRRTKRFRRARQIEFYKGHKYNHIRDLKIAAGANQGRLVITSARTVLVNDCMC